MFAHIEHPLLPQFQRAASYIASCQQADGAIRWFDQGKLDPWDHTEAAMALGIAGREDLAINAFRWLAQQQQANGSWQANYFLAPCDQDIDDTKVETNFVAYPATGLWHHYLIFSNTQTLRDFYPMVRAAIDYVVSQQTAHGDIQWAQSQREPLPRDALVTACSSVLRSLECAVNIAITLGEPNAHWQLAHRRLADALRNKPWRFDRTWESKRRFSMDWFYPILAGIYSEQEAQLRLEQRWHEFVVSDLGCRCVSDEPWVTAAESSELVLACVAAGWRDRAESIHRWLSQWQDTDGGFWTGYSFRDKVIWPQEKTSWTGAAYLLAADALFQFTPAHDLLTRPHRIRASCAVTPPETPPDSPA
ncbi:conserved hypothetical protein [Teredinibacter turnerae T7901]|uniref:Prenyltransferase n=1 Tax=Teredinibacter turnerae (strain ATCC 39867 / T7901) TaxID=377629 RepID=C5BME7_TERTT|nr:hypothetical protein [Teredinibacter turnerae]ACR12047.1 conserved hypothetical protein [Teredinibacter turnerae T7901]